MKRTAMIFSLIFSLAGSLVYAETPPALSDVQLSQIKANCVSIKSTLNRIHANDGLVRVNQGQQYEIISTKLMAPLNSRIALNRLDGVALSQTTVDYNTQLDVFRDDYRRYEQSLSELLRFDCLQNPKGFYEKLIAVRKERSTVNTTTVQLKRYIDTYGTQFDTFRTRQLSIGQGGSAQ